MILYPKFKQKQIISTKLEKNQQSFYHFVLVVRPSKEELIKQIKKTPLNRLYKQANFKSQDEPDFSQQIRDSENAQKGNDRVGATNNIIAQNDTKGNEIIQDSANSYVRYSSANAYSKTQKQVIKPVQKLNSTTIIDKIPAIVLPKKVKQKQKPISRKQTNEREENISEIIGFNIVVLSTQYTASKIENTIKKATNDYIKAAIYGTQTARSGSQVRVRLLEN